MAGVGLVAGVPNVDIDIYNQMIILAFSGQMSTIGALPISRPREPLEA